MKKALLFILFPLLSIGQTQIGADIDGEAAGDESGRSVSISSDGSVLAIGNYLNDGNGSDSGSVRVYKNISGTWTQVGADINGEAADDSSGSSVSLSPDGSFVAIGSPGNNNSTGSVRVYKNVSGTWTKVGADIDGEAAIDESGSSVSLSADGNIVAIGAYSNDGSGTMNSGSVRVYKNVSGTWTKVGADIDGVNDYDNNGFSVSLSGDGSVLAVGAPGSKNSSGSVKVYKNVSGIWTQIGISLNGENANLEVGKSVSLSVDGSVLAFGVPGINNSKGSVRVYKNISGNWTKIGSDIIGNTDGDYSGNSVSLSADGSVLAIGAPGNGIFGSISGSVQIYKNVSGTWTKVGLTINGESLDDHSGYSVSLSGNGTKVAIGAYSNSGNGNRSGSVRVYDLSAVLSSDSFVLANFSVYPNPASEIVTITLEEGLKLEKVNVYNSLGQLVKTENKDVIAVNSLAKGNYFFEVITNKGKAAKQIIVQ